MTATQLEHRAVKVLTRLHFGRRKPIKSLSKSRQTDWRKTRSWGWKTQIKAIAAGVKRAEGKQFSDIPCLTVYVRKKLPAPRIPSNEFIPETLRLETLGAEVLTDIVELSGPIVAHAASEIQPGTQVAHFRGEPGTLAVLVRKAGSSQILALSCSHVLARSGVNVQEGDLVEHPFSIVMPDPRTNEFGRLTKSFVTFSPGQVASQDYALATIDVPPIAAQADTGILVDTVLNPAGGFQIGTPTLMNGVITKQAHGTVANSNWSGTIENFPFVGDLDFENLIAYDTACSAGDSGAAVLQDGTTSIMGIHVGGSSQDQFGLFMPISPVMHDLGLSLYTG